MLTAAQCVSHMSETGLTTQAGAYNLYDDAGTDAKIEIKKALLHPGFSGGPELQHDVGLIELKKPACKGEDCTLPKLAFKNGQLLEWLSAYSADAVFDVLSWRFRGNVETSSVLNIAWNLTLATVVAKYHSLMTMAMTR